MKRNIRLFIIIIILIILAFFMYQLAFHKPNQTEDFSEVKRYLRDIYGETFLIPEFQDINEASEDWLWENINQYVKNHDDEYHEQNSQDYGYTYEEVSKIAKIIYGDNLTKKFPKGAVSMRYNSYRDLYAPTSFIIKNYYEYTIDSIERTGNTYTISLYDFTISLENFNNDDNADDTFKIFNNYDYLLNADNGTPILSIKTLDDKKFQNILDQKEKLSHKILTIEYDEAEKLYHIKSCQYEGTTNNDILATSYYQMQQTFEIMEIDYNQEDIYTQEEVLVKNFDELTSIYTENALPTYQEEMNVFVYKDNGDVYFTAGDITVADYLVKIEFKDIEASSDKISCNVIRTFRESFNPADEEYNQTYQKEDKFTIVKIDDTWFIDEFSYNNL